MRTSSVFAMLRNRMKREEIYSTSEYWDSKAVEYCGDAISMWPNSNLNYYYHREQISLITRYLSDLNGARVLDVGCGTGRISRSMAERGARVLGIDYSVKAIQIAKRESKKDNPCYKVCSIFQLNEQNAFDIVISCGSLTFACRNRKELLESMERLRQALKSNGKLLLLEPVHRGFLHRVLDLDIKEFCGVMVEAGFKIERMTNLHFWPMRLALANMSWPRFITAAGYHSGQWIMKLFGNKIFGDCRAIYALIR